MSTQEGRTAARGGMSRAVVCAGGVETAYRRAGYGPVVVVLGLAAGDGTALPDELVPLVARFRVIVPDHEMADAFAASHAGDDARSASWLHGFLEGLGVEGVSVVAPARFGPALERHAATDPGDVAHVVLIENATTGTDWSAIARAISGTS